MREARADDAHVHDAQGDEARAEEPQAENARPNDIVVEAAGLVKQFGRATALGGLDLVVRRGEVHGFLGPNGAGKSTTLRILLGLARASAGRVAVFGRDPWRDAVQLHARIDGRRCQRVSEVEGSAVEGSAVEGSEASTIDRAVTQFLRDGVYIQVEQLDFPTDGLLPSIVDELWG